MSEPKISQPSTQNQGGQNQNRSGAGRLCERHLCKRHELTMKWVFWMTGNYGSHADTHYDPKALPVIQGINYRDIVAENVSMAARLEGISGDPFTGICISNATIGLAKKVPWTCTDIAGVTSGVTPKPCGSLPDQGPEKVGMCAFPTENLPIDYVEIKKCSYRMG